MEVLLFQAHTTTGSDIRPGPSSSVRKTHPLMICLFMGFFLRSYTYKLILITLFTGIIKQHTQESHFTIVATLNYHNKVLNFE